MGPDPDAPATGGEVEASAEATIAAAAVTLETLQEAIETEAEVSEERQSELLTEVRECRKKLEALSNSITGTESPALQQLLLQMGQLQTSIEAIQADMAILTESDEETPGEGAEEKGDASEVPEKSSPQSISPSSRKDGSDTGNDSKRNNESNPPGSNPSPTPVPPKRKRYVKI